MSRKFRFPIATILALTLLATVGIVFFILSSPKSKNISLPSDHKMAEDSALNLLWISLDGLQKSKIEHYLQFVANPHPRGFQYLIDAENWNSELEITNPTITASSHISTITCTPPGQHGIIANRQWDGANFVIGFTAPYEQQNFVKVLRDSGKKVASLGYPSIDGSRDDRQATWGVSYDDPVNQSSFLTMSWGEKKTLHLPSRTHSNEPYPIEIEISADGSAVIITNGDNKITTHLGDWIDIFFTLSDVKHLTIISYLAHEDRKISLYISPTMVNNAHPIDFRNQLDAMDLVFSPGKDSNLKAQHGNLAFFKSMEHRLRYFTKVAQHILEQQKPQVFFLYLEDLDALGHQFEGESAMDELIGSYFTKLDQAFGSIMELVADTTNVVILGDHGMAATNYDYNIQKILEPESSANLRIVTSGGAYFAYGVEAQLTSEPPIDAPWFQRAIQDLKNATVEFDQNRKVFHSVIVKNSAEASQLGLDGDAMPWIMAFAEPGISLKVSFEDRTLLARRSFFSLTAQDAKTYPDPIVNGRLVEPRPFGSHGHIASSAEMRSSLVMFGPAIGHVSASAARLNIDVVPLVADALGLPRPSGCQVKD